MKKLKITTQAELDALIEISVDQELTIESSVTLRLNKMVEVNGKLKILSKIECSRLEGRYFRAWGNSSVEARENSSVVARGNSSVVARENSSVVAWENSSVKIVERAFRGIVTLFAFAAVWVPIELRNPKIHKKADTATIITYSLLPYLERNGVEIKDGKVVLYKRVSSDFKTQEETKDETLWLPGTTVVHPNWGNLNKECGEGKYHACSRPYFCDEFRSKKDDRYVAIEVKVADLHEWKDNPQYPYKIAFRECIVLYECNKMGTKK